MSTDWLKWNGVDCTTKGIYVLRQPAPQSPEIRGDEQTVPWRSGSMFLSTGAYMPMTFEAECLCKTEADMWTAIAWLSGKGTLEIATRSGGYWNAWARKGFTSERKFNGHAAHTFTVAFEVEPYWYPDDGQSWNTQAASGATAQKNITLADGSVLSPSVWRITDTNGGTSSLYSYTMQLARTGGDTASVTIDLTSVIGSLGIVGTYNIYLDCQAKQAYLEYTATGATAVTQINLNPFTVLDGDEWPMLGAGSNACTCTGGTMTAMGIKTNRRCI